MCDRMEKAKEIIKELDGIINWVGTPFGYTFDEFYPKDLRADVEAFLRDEPSGTQAQTLRD